MNRFLLLLTAAFGGMAPNLMDLGVSLTKGGDLPDWSYVIGVLIFGAMGAGVAAIWKEANFKKAFYLGIGLPALIQLGVGTASQGNTADMTMKIESLLNMSSIAFAQEHAESVPGRTLKIIPQGVSQNQEVVFSFPESTRTETVKIKGENEQEIKVPDFASSFEIKQGVAFSEKVALPEIPNVQSKVEVKVEKKSWSGLLRAIGARNMSSQNIVVRQVE